MCRTYFLQTSIEYQYSRMEDVELNIITLVTIMKKGVMLNWHVPLLEASSELIIFLYYPDFTATQLSWNPAIMA